VRSVPRAGSRRQPYDRRFSDHIGELSTRATNSCTVGRPDIQIHSTGVQLIHRPVVSDLDLSFRASHWPADPSQTLLTYTAEPGSPSDYASASPGPLGRDHRRLRAAAPSDTSSEAASFREG
jgi:MmyB-like transcription regulator ligand binding domain